MSIVVVGGQARKVGKTSVVEGILAALPERRWTAVKITRCHHAEPDCHCALHGDSFRVMEEHERTSAADTSRFLAAGARHSFWMRMKADGLREAAMTLKQIVVQAEDVIVESSSVLQWLSPDVVICVQGPAGTLSKLSYDDLRKRADALVAQETSPVSEVGPPVFTLGDKTGKLGVWVESELKAKEKAHRL